MGGRLLKTAKDWLIRGYWGTLLAYILCCVFAFSVIWIFLEPTGWGENWGIPQILTTKRFFLHTLLSLLIGPAILIVIMRIELDKSHFHFFGPTGQRFEPKHSSQFYNKIAEKYDDRNSASLYAAHHKVIDIVNSALNDIKRSASKDEVMNLYNRDVRSRLLDIGGGTGKLVAYHFYKISSIEWHYVDESPLMLQQFCNNMRGSKLKIFTTLNEADVYISDNISSNLAIGHFDIIIISFSLTSMHKNPDWMSISRMLRSGGTLIIADIDASYTAKNPFYSVTTVDGDFHLMPRPVPLSILISEISASGLNLESATPIKQNTADYAYVAEFKKA
jgi:ubiquinone/menaquinone biosynthesis C-methylase UbiE